MRGPVSGKRCGLQSVIDQNESAFRISLEAIKAVVVAHGHHLVRHRSSDTPHCRANSAFTETNVKWPTDVALRWDAVRNSVKRLAALCHKHGITCWRKAANWLKKVKRVFARVHAARKRRGTNKVKELLALCLAVITTAEDSIQMLNLQGNEDEACARHWNAGRLCKDQVSRCLIHGEKVPHSEKRLSIRVRQTRRINRKQTGVRAELGVPVCVLESQHQFVLTDHVLHQGHDRDMIQDFLTEPPAPLPNDQVLRLGDGNYTPANLEKLDELLDLPVLSQRGRLSARNRAGPRSRIRRRTQTASGR